MHRTWVPYGTDGVCRHMAPPSEWCAIMWHPSERAVWQPGETWWPVRGVGVGVSFSAPRLHYRSSTRRMGVVRFVACRMWLSERMMIGLPRSILRSPSGCSLPLHSVLGVLKQAILANRAGDLTGALPQAFIMRPQVRPRASFIKLLVAGFSCFLCCCVRGCFALVAEVS